MPRKIVPLITGETYHIYNRGVDKRPVFLNKQNYLRFYTSLNYFNTKKPINSIRDIAKDVEITSADKLVQIKAYCLLPNHYHLLLEQLTDGGISEFMKRVGGGYTLYFNEKKKRSGALFQGTYKRVHVNTDEYYNYLFAYINENHSVHNINEVQQIYTTSSVHFRGVKKSKVISGQSDGLYNAMESKKLASCIHKKRFELSDSVLKIDT